MRRSLETPRLLLRPLCPGDAGWMCALLSDVEVMRYILPRYGSRDQARPDVELRITADLRSPWLGYWAIEERGANEVVGWVALKKLAAEDIEVGYRLQRASWGRGIATEAARRMLHYGFEEVGLDRIVAVTMPENVLSGRVLEKLGFRLERRYLQDGAEWCYFALTRGEWATR